MHYQGELSQYITTPGRVIPVYYHTREIFLKAAITREIFLKVAITRESYPSNIPQPERVIPVIFLNQGDIPQGW